MKYKYVFLCLFYFKIFKISRIDVDTMDIKYEIINVISFRDFLDTILQSAVSLSLNHLTAVSGVGSSPALATCETSQVLLAGVSGGFSRGSPIFAPPTYWPVSYEMK